jgi:hypothetical protein
VFIARQGCRKEIAEGSNSAYSKGAGFHNPPVASEMPFELFAFGCSCSASAFLSFGQSGKFSAHPAAKSLKVVLGARLRDR